MDEQRVREIIRQELSFLIKNNKLVFDRPMQILDGNDITAGRNIGTRIGTGVDQKIAFFGTLPTSQQGSIANPVGGATVDAQARSVIAALIYTFSVFGFTAT